MPDHVKLLRRIIAHNPFVRHIMFSSGIIYRDDNGCYWFDKFCVWVALNEI